MFEKYELSRSHPLLGRDHLRPLADQLLDDIELPAEQRVLLHVHLVDVHLEQVKVEACGRVEKCTCFFFLPGTVFTRPEKLEPTCISLREKI